jgi:N-formylmaleamate deformylase
MAVHTKNRRFGRHVISNKIRMHYVKIGTGNPPLIILPGITSPAATWEFVANEFAASRDVYIIDFRGRGLSQGGQELSYRLDDYAADISEFIGMLGLDRPVILGHSMGARVAIRLASGKSIAESRCIFVDPPTSGPGRRSYPIPAEYYLKSLDSVARGEGYEDLKANFGWTDAQIEARMEWLPTCDPVAIIESHKSFHDEDIFEDLKFINQKCLLMYAENGGTVTDSEAQEIKSGLKDCQVCKIQGAGHMIPWDRLPVFVEEVGKFITSP